METGVKPSRQALASAGKKAPMVQGFEDCYEDLQVSPHFDQETIEWFYRLLAKRYHPDNGGFAIAAAGVDEIEKEGELLGKNLMLPEKTEPGEAGKSLWLFEHISTDAAEKLGQAIATLKKLDGNSVNLIAWVFLANRRSRLGRKRRAKEAVDHVQRIDPLFSLEDFSRTLKFKDEKGRVRFRKYARLARPS